MTERLSPNAGMNFLRDLQGLTTRIHSTARLDDILTELGQDICAVFSAERVTLYVTSSDGRELIAKIKTGLEGVRELRVPVNDRSIAGFAANHKQLLNLADVYDEAALKKLSPTLQFLQAVDQRTGFRTREMLVAPIVQAGDGVLVGVVQLINSSTGSAFEGERVEGTRMLAETLAVALRQRQQSAFPFIPKHRFDKLINDGLLSPAAFQVAVKEAQKKQRDVELVLQEGYGIATSQIGQALAAFYQVAYEPFAAGQDKPAELLARVKREQALAEQWLPLDELDGVIRIVTPDPEMLRSTLVAQQWFAGRKLDYVVTTRSEFLQMLAAWFGDNVPSMPQLALADDVDLPEEPSAAESAASDNEVVQLANQIIVEAYRLGASDIHIEPYPGRDKTQIRFRRDGNLQAYREIPASYRSPLVTRLKIMCDLDIAERRKPQDGKIKLKKFVPELDIELRVATIPTAGGVEDVVMRILAAGEPLPLEKLALSDSNLVQLKTVISKPYGLFFVCGPTGSGKTTTLHSVLKYLNTPETKIWTAEDPVEITQKGLRQVQVNAKAGLTFASVMRAFLRADPDVIMVGEMRDAETAGTGIEASLTGHLVLATLHTNSAPESVIRLLDMGMDPFNFADALLGILAQRLARRLCKCKEAYEASDADLLQLAREYADELLKTPAWRSDPDGCLRSLQADWRKRYARDGKITLYRPKGCPECANTGYKGRLGLHELLVGSDRVKQLVQERARVAEILAAALEEGMTTLKQDGIEKVLAGLTDLAQVRAVCIK
ncbi:GspE/PulE family protein [Chitinilyticum piscinae]|uniref:GspE/PulE family protein n=1 Tax=Chitinilyticum piscinae TaxID=2866724 RepID=A0A8J7KAB7_9NEIS|nr:GspE/PulE family protein [Chitinilyticum piscinae]MBE9608974.1 GspE/PulE family protein [Chitinilyticum piscinae]